jgi:hypothetical protein
MRAGYAIARGLWYGIFGKLFAIASFEFVIFGSEQEFVETRILGCFLKNDEFGLGDCHALGLEQQVAEILVAAAPSK